MTSISRTLPLFLLCATNVLFCSEDENQHSPREHDLQAHMSGAVASEFPFSPNTPISASPQLPRRRSSSRTSSRDTSCFTRQRGVPSKSTARTGEDSDSSDSDDPKVPAPVAHDVQKHWVLSVYDAVQSSFRSQRTTTEKLIKSKQFCNEYPTARQREDKIEDTLTEYVSQEETAKLSDYLSRAADTIEFANENAIRVRSRIRKRLLEILQQRERESARLHALLVKKSGKQKNIVTVDSHSENKEETKVGSQNDVRRNPGESGHSKSSQEKRYSQNDDRLYSSEEDQS